MTGDEPQRPIEETLRRALVDTALRNVPNAARPPASPDPARRPAFRWIAPLLAAAVVVAVAVSVLAVRLTADGGHTPIGHSSVPFPAPSSSGHSSSASSSPIAPTPQPTTSARVHVPPPIPRPTQTKKITLHPVLRSGRPAPGYTVRDGGSAIVCDGISRFAVGALITAACTPSAEGPFGCYRAAATQALCLQDVWERTLVRYRLAAGAPIDRTGAGTDPRLFALELAHGMRCKPRSGGAWGILQRHPTWTGYWECGAAGDVWGPVPSAHEGIDMSGQLWTVHVFPFAAQHTAPGVVRGVARAYYLAGRH